MSNTGPLIILVALLAVGFVGYVLLRRRRPKTLSQYFDQKLNEIHKLRVKRSGMRKRVGGYYGVEATFRCGHTGQIMMKDKGGSILRLVKFGNAQNVPCHDCYLKGSDLFDKRAEEGRQT